MNYRKVRHEASTYAGKEGALEPFVSSIVLVSDSLELLVPALHCRRHEASTHDIFEA